MKASPSPFDTLRRLEPRERRVVAAGAIVSAAMLATVWLVLPFAQHWAARESRLAAARERWDRVATLVANTGRLRQTLDSARRASAADAGDIVAGATPALAASAIQDVLQRDATQSGVQLERVDAAGEPHADKPGLLAIPVQVQARGDLYGLAGFLARVEHGSPLLVADELTINAGLDEGEGDNTRLVSTRAAGARQMLTWTLRLHGLYEGTAEPAP
jgi:Type II secretion system (T2SS), protein M subtype b